MHYYPYGPVEIPRDESGLVFIDPSTARQFWDAADELDFGLSTACGCYIFAVRAGKGVRPWYVGRAVNQAFKKECLTDHKVNKYNSVLSKQKGTPLIYFYARMTASGDKFCKPTVNKYHDTEFLEKHLIGLAFHKNSYLLNRNNLKILRDIYVPGLFNTKKGTLPVAAAQLRRVLGIS
jgi:hypothetical protein